MNSLRCALAIAAVGSICLSVGASSAVPTATAHLTLQSQPGDYIGQGENFDETYTGPANDVSVLNAQVDRTTLSGAPDLLFFSLNAGTPGTNRYGFLFFGTEQLGIPIAPGTYNDAREAIIAPPGHPELEVSWQHRGSDQTFGAFTVTDVTFFQDTRGLEVGTFAASFEQHSESLSAPALFGTFTYRNSAAPVPEPGSLVLLVTGAPGLLLHGRRMRRGGLRRSQSGF